MKPAAFAAVGNGGLAAVAVGGFAVLRGADDSIFRVCHRAARASICCSVTRVFFPSGMRCFSAAELMARPCWPAYSASILRSRAARRRACHHGACDPDRVSLRTQCGHLLRHAYACFRHAVLFVSVQVLSPHRRRQRHARAAHETPGARACASITRSSSCLARSTTTAWR